MDLSKYVTQLREDLASAAAAGDEQTQRTGALLGAAIEPAARLALMNALSDLAAEVTAALGDRVVEVRLDGRDVRVAVSPDPAQPTSRSRRPQARPTRASDPAASRGFGGDAGDISRVTLRLVEQIKSQAEQAAANQGMSLNSWVAQAVQGALAGHAAREVRPTATAGTASASRGGCRDERPDRLHEGRRTAVDTELVRRESWPVKGVAELELSVDVGRIEVHLDRADEPEVQVEVRHDPAAGGVWGQGISGVINWIGQATAGPGCRARRSRRRGGARPPRSPGRSRGGG